MESMRDGDVSVVGTPKIDYFKCQSIEQLIQFKWNSGAGVKLQLSCMTNVLYWIVIIDYICWFYYGPEVYPGLVGYDPY